MGVLEHVLELADSTNDLALLFAGGVITAILLEITLCAGSLYLLDDIGEAWAFEFLELGT